MMNTETQSYAGVPLARRVIEISPAPAAIIDREGTIVFVNEKLIHLLGYARDELVGRSSDLFLPGTLHRLQAAQLACCLSHSEAHPPIDERTVVARAKNGPTFPVIISVYPIAERRETLYLAHFVHGDRLSLDHDRLQSERLAAIAQMIQGLAHESRNALQRAVACLDLLELDLKHNPEQMILSQQIRDSLGDLIENYDEVRRYAEPISLKLREVNLLHLCQVAFDELAVQHDSFPHRLRFSPARDRHGFDEHHFDQHDFVQLDRDKMKQVLRSILQNAIEAADEIAQIEIGCERIHWRGEPAVRLTIHDQGHGFRPESLPQVFEPFYTTKQHGTGLALAIGRRIIEAHRGEIHAINHVDGGAVIEMTLAIHRPPILLPQP